MLDFLNNSVLQFIINLILTVGVGSIIPIWLAFRQPILLPITYETISVKLVDDIEEIQKIKEKMQVSFDDDILKHPCLVTFKIQNSGRECINLLEYSKPLIIRFKKGARVLGWDDLETVPSRVEVTPKLNKEDLLLEVPILNPKESIKLRVLLSDYIDALPEEIDARIPAKKTHSESKQY